MRCVSTVSYYVLLNGQPGEKFYPTRGLRQRDPLSPYLFFFCAEVFSSLIRKAELTGSIHGIRVCKRAPTVSHFFFADTVLFSVELTRGRLIQSKKLSSVMKAQQDRPLALKNLKSHLVQGSQTTWQKPSQPVWEWIMLKSTRFIWASQQWWVDKKKLSILLSIKFPKDWNSGKDDCSLLPKKWSSSNR